MIETDLSRSLKDSVRALFDKEDWAGVITAVETSGLEVPGTELEDDTRLRWAQAYRYRRNFEAAESVLLPLVEKEYKAASVEYAKVAFLAKNYAAARERALAAFRKFGSRMPWSLYVEILDACRYGGGFSREISEIVQKHMGDLDDSDWKKADLATRHAYRVLSEKDKSLIGISVAILKDAIRASDRLKRTDSVRTDRLHRRLSLLTALWHSHLYDENHAATARALVEIVRLTRLEPLGEVAFQGSYNPIRACVLMGFIGLLSKNLQVASTGMQAALGLFRQAGRDIDFHYVMLGEFGRTVHLMQHAAKLYRHVERAEGAGHGKISFRMEAEQEGEVDPIRLHCFREGADDLYALVLKNHAQLARAIKRELAKLLVASK